MAYTWWLGAHRKPRHPYTIQTVTPINKQGRIASFLVTIMISYCHYIIVLPFLRLSSCAAQPSPSHLEGDCEFDPANQSKFLAFSTQWSVPGHQSQTGYAKWAVHEPKSVVGRIRHWPSAIRSHSPCSCNRRSWKIRMTSELWIHFFPAQILRCGAYWWFTS